MRSPPVRGLEMCNNAYAQNQDLINYSPLCANLQAAQLTALIRAAEDDLDQLVLPPTVLTASQQRLTASGTLSGGTFIASLDWIGNQTYTSPPVNYNVNGWDLVWTLNQMTNQFGFPLPSATCWQIPPNSPNNIEWPEGPLNTAPVEVQASSDFDEQMLQLLQIDSTNLVGGTVTVTETVVGGRKVDPTWLEPKQVRMLTRATCAQAEYRQMMGANFFIRAQFDDVSGPVFKTTGKLPLVGPKVRRELTQSGLLLIHARSSWGRSRRPSGIGVGWPPYYTPEGGDVW